MSEERRAKPEPGATVPDLGPASSTSEIAALAPDSSPELPPARPAAVLAMDEPSRDSSPPTRRRGRMALRIPDDEVSRPQLARSEPPPEPPPDLNAVVVTPMRIIAINAAESESPPAPMVDADSSPVLTEGAALQDEDSWTPFQPTVVEEPQYAAQLGRGPMLPDEVIAVDADAIAQADLAPVSFETIEVGEPEGAPAPPMSPESAASPAPAIDPSAAEPDGEEVRFDDDVPTPPPPAAERISSIEGAPRSDPGAEIALEDLVAVEPPAPPLKLGGPLPPMRPRLASQPPGPPPPNRKTAALKGGKPPLVIVPPHVGTLAPTPAEGAGPRRKGRLWWEELFNDDYLRACEKLTDDQIGREVDFIEDSLSIEKGGTVLDLACGTGRHAIELSRRGYEVVGFDLSLAMLARAGDEAQDREAKLNFIQGDMREMTFDEQFDGAYCWNTSFGYFDEEKNAQVIERLRGALKSEGLLLLDVVNRDFLIRQSPSLAWFEGDGCVCMDEMAVDFITSRMKVKRTIMLDDGRSRELEYSMRIYSLHELGRILHEHGFKVCEVSGRVATPGVYFGNESPRTLILAEKR